MDVSPGASPLLTGAQQSPTASPGVPMDIDDADGKKYSPIHQ